MKKITKKQRIDQMNERGFHHCGHISGEYIKHFISELHTFKEKLNEEFANMIYSTTDLTTISKIRSLDFIDSRNVVYGFKGSTYQYNDFLIHIYDYKEFDEYTVSFILLAK